MTKPISFRWPEEFIARIDAARKTSIGTVSRAAFVRDAVELAVRRVEAAQALAEQHHSLPLPDQAKLEALRQPTALTRAEAFRKATQG